MPLCCPAPSAPSMARSKHIDRSPRVLTVVLCAYAHGVVSRREIERLCREHVVFITLCLAPSAWPWAGRARH